jgi:2-oxoglutarate ferredoxin oxidoreductase subunit alpha
MKRWEVVKANEVRFKEYMLEDAEIAVIGFGTAGRVSLTAIREARAEGIPVGLFRPITLNPFPFEQIDALAERVKLFLVVEMNAGQMYEDIRLATRDRIPIEFYGRMGGVVPFPDEVLKEIRRVYKEPISQEGTARKRWLDRLSAIIEEEN